MEAGCEEVGDLAPPHEKLLPFLGERSLCLGWGRGPEVTWGHQEGWLVPGSLC